MLNWQHGRLATWSNRSRIIDQVCLNTKTNPFVLLGNSKFQPESLIKPKMKHQKNSRNQKLGVFNMPWQQSQAVGLHQRTEGQQPENTLTAL